MGPMRFLNNVERDTPHRVLMAMDGTRAAAPDLRGLVPHVMLASTGHLDPW